MHQYLTFLSKNHLQGCAAVLQLKVSSNDGSEGLQSRRIHIRVIRKTSSQTRVMQASHHYWCPQTLGVELPLALSLISYEAATHMHSQETCWLESVKSTWQSAEARWHNVKCFELFKGGLPQLWAATLRVSGNDSALRSVHEHPQRRGRQKSDTVEDFWKQLNGLVSKTVVNWWLVKSDQRGRSSFISAVSGHRRSYLRPCLHRMVMKKQGLKQYRGWGVRVGRSRSRPCWLQLVCPLSFLADRASPCPWGSSQIICALLRLTQFHIDNAERRCEQTAHTWARR